MYIPEGFGTITPYIFVNTADAFSDFVATAFGGVERGRTTRPDGVIANLQMEVGTSMIMVSEATEQYPAMPAAYYLYVEDCDSVTNQAILAGGVLKMAVADMSYGDRQSGVEDPFGNIWWISQRLVHGPY